MIIVSKYNDEDANKNLLPQFTGMKKSGCYRDAVPLSLATMKIKSSKLSLVLPTSYLVPPTSYLILTISESSAPHLP